MSVVVEPLFSVPTVRALLWTATEPHTGMKESYAVGRVERGRGRFVANGRLVDAAPRSLHLRQPGDVHRDVGREGPITLSVLSFAPSALDEVGRRPVRLEPTLAPGDPRGAPLHRVLDAARGGIDGLARDAAVAEALTALAPLDGPCRHTRAVRRARAMLHERIAEAVTLDELAAHAGLDKYRLCRAFRAEVGLRPHAWLTALRVARAKELLASGTALRDVPPLVGFYDQSQLNRHFRRIVGTTPARWTREMAG